MDTNSNPTPEQVEAEYLAKVERWLTEVAHPLRERAIALMAEYVTAAGLVAAYRAECILKGGGDGHAALEAVVAASAALTADLERTWLHAALDQAQAVADSGTPHAATAEILGFPTPTV